MYLAKVRIEGYRVFHKPVTVCFNKGLNLIVGENGCGKSTVIDAIRLLLNEDEYSRSGIKDEDFYSSLDKEIQDEKISIKGIFLDLSEEKKVEYLSWLTPKYNALLNLDIMRKQDKRNNFKKTIWGGESSNSIFEWEPLNDIQCVYLPALRDAEKKLRANRGSRLARLLLNLSKEEMKERRKSGELMDIEKDVNDFNEEISKRSNIARANKLINESLLKALGSVFGQSIKIQFNDLSYERIVEALRLVFFPGLTVSAETEYRNLFENSLGYNNLIYIATILAEFEGLKEEFSSPRILLIEELEAHLHPQVQMKLLKYLDEQAQENDIQVIITTHSTTIASATPINKIISLNVLNNGKIRATALRKCGIEDKAEKFINRWLDATKSTLLFSKGIILVEGIAEAILVPELAEIYLAELNKNSSGLPSSLEEAGISVINMNGIYFQYFMQLYRGYQLEIPNQNPKETKDEYSKQLIEFRQKGKFAEGEYKKTKSIPIRCVALTDNDPNKENKPTQKEQSEGKNPQLYLIEQLKNMTENCRVFTNLKTFEYDMALEVKNAQDMIGIILGNLETDGDIKKQMNSYLGKIDKSELIDQSEMAFDILKQVDGNYLGKGLFAQLLSDRIDDTKSFVVPEYIKKAINFVLKIQECGNEN